MCVTQVVEARSHPEPGSACGVHRRSPPAVIEVGMVDAAAAWRGEQQVLRSLAGCGAAQYLDRVAAEGHPSARLPRLGRTEVVAVVVGAGVGAGAGAVALPCTAHRQRWHRRIEVEVAD